MNFTSSHKTKHWVQIIKEFLGNSKLESILADSDSEQFPWYVRQEAGKKDLIGLDIDVADGGSGLSAVTMGHIYHECGRTSVNTRELFGAGHGRLIAKFGTPEQKKRYLPRLISGELLVGVGLTEPNCGSDLAKTQTTAVRNGDYYILNGEKEWVSRVEESDVLSTLLISYPLIWI
ncbi:acyl-CoA dehydrogenase family protein [Bacillus sp. DX4.1]|uniref:acyl-CoA dehydrogenase family protein n=1 Tax=Bacillus sp. DX4.1 TaxID=3055867 RepID=UPI0025A092ED|nr:acyl-CoA dehydrogenase family protein [Bacillus sp. DX4.1]MDM5189149.1 acyl-CoA dehydrogenase family protein [Bacillus sp. DX4.1]